MSDLKADTQRIRECSRALQRIYDAFTSRADPADDYSAAELGNHLVVEAFDEFSSNWKIHRKDLAGKIRTLGVITGEAAKSYDAIDAKLADALRKHDAEVKRNGDPK
ncbi:hypothetical protein [Streptomyces sp. NPDC090053]|uniref:hypothetical protein n=1 Tax=Streptomyces sp. NPDC090053 TaxID=3365932 RepID=UPI003807A74E